MDVKAAFLQARNFNREICVRPPKEERCGKTIWQLTKAAYGLVDSPRLWFITGDNALVNNFNLSRSKVEPTLYYSKCKNGDLRLIVVVQLNNYIYAGTEYMATEFERFLKNTFHIGEHKQSNFELYGCEITTAYDGTIRMTLLENIASLNEKELNVGDQKTSGNEVADPKELTAYMSVLGKLLFTGGLAQPIALFYASYMATKTTALLKHHLKDLRALVRAVKRTTPELAFTPAPLNTKFSLEIYSDASMDSKKTHGARGGLLIVRRAGDIIHPLYWHSRKLRRVARSSSTTEILAAADGIDFGIHLKRLLDEVTSTKQSESPECSLLSLIIDSRCLFNLIGTTRQPEEARNRADLAAIREAVETGLLCTICWITGHYHAVDALTKNKTVTAAHLLKILRTGEYPKHPQLLLRESPNSIPVSSTE